MELGNPALEFLDQCHRINARGFDPEDIDFKFHVLRELVDEDVITALAAVLGFELEVVVVVGELDARLFGHGGGLVRVVGDFLVVVEGLAVAVLEIRNHEVAQADGFRLLEDFREIRHCRHPSG